MTKAAKFWTARLAPLAASSSSTSAASTSSRRAALRALLWSSQAAWAGAGIVVSPGDRYAVWAEDGGDGGAVASADHANLANALDFTVVRERSNDLPYSKHYVENAERLAANLKWCSTHLDAANDAALKDQIRSFAALYRRDLYTSYGAMPGLNALETAYTAVAAHYVRFGPGKVAMSEALAGTVARNVGLAEKALAKQELTSAINAKLVNAERPE